MASQASTKRHARWNSAFRKTAELRRRIDQAHGPELERLGRDLAAETDILMSLPAPTLEAVRLKLMVLWETDVEKPDLDGAEKLLILEDLQDISDEIAQLIGARA